MFTLVNCFKNDKKTNDAACEFKCSNDVKAMLNQNKYQAHDSDAIKNIEDKALMFPEMRVILKIGYFL